MSDNAGMPEEAVVQFICRGTAVGKMRNEMDVTMVQPFEERFELATDEGKFHGGDATAPPPLAMFVGALTGCIMTQIRAFAKRLGVTLNDLQVDTRIQWNWRTVGRVYETAPKGFEIDVMIDSPDAEEKVMELIETAKKGCFIEQTLGVSNTINHRMKTANGWRDV
ncbi:MAG: OsmC family protein [Hyphomicrobiales bacterium]|nr:OsmC family protein [Hyphomicrobiales bacterium]MCP5001902.1 OsmC family protein [Hyphomicrobiales bacterium]